MSDNRNKITQAIQGFQLERRDFLKLGAMAGQARPLAIQI